jgi:hypothetical protein
MEKHKVVNVHFYLIQGRTQMTPILQIFTDFILFYLYLCRSVLICVIRVPLNLEPRTQKQSYKVLKNGV